MKHAHHYRSHWRRGIYALLFVAAVVAVVTLGMRWFEGMSYLDAFYFTSMIATAQGSATTPGSAGGKIFAALLAYVSVGAVVAALGFFFGPFFGQLWHAGVTWMEEETHQSKKH